MPVRVVLFLALFLLSGVGYSAEERQKISIGVGNFEPFFIPSEDKGLFVEVINTVYRHLPQYDVELIYLSNDRIVQELRLGRIDAGANIMNASGEDAKFFSDPVFQYSDVAISLKKNKIRVDDISDLAHYRVATFQGAKAFFGETFSDVVSSNPYYAEYHSVPTTMQLLAKERVDVIVIDLHMIPYFIDKYLEGELKAEDLYIHRIFPIPTAYTYMGFSTKEMRDGFDSALKKTIESGEYDALYKKYLIAEPD
ncbi:transporter substrate-binding domain-containing protein [Alteromonadaceae bacterium M269]|nr:transporter substrate-binding domain-containing protein [Alteromonadaceae bacterium M269]